MAEKLTGEQLRARRDKLKLTQAELAELLGVAPNTVARWERSERGIPATVSLAIELIASRKNKSPKPKNKA